MSEDEQAYVVSIEVDGRQKYLFESDKLREMLGASLIMDQTRVLSKDAIPEGSTDSENWFSKAVKVFQPASGDVRAWSADRQALIEGTIKAKHWLTERGLQHTISWLCLPKAIFKKDAENASGTQAVTQISNPSDKSDKEPPPQTLSEGHRCLSRRARERKDAKSYPDARPQWSLFAQCRIHGQEPAEFWYPNAATDDDRKDARRALTGSRAEAKFKQWEESKKGNFYKENLENPFWDRLKEVLGLDDIDAKRSITFQDLSNIDQPEDQYLAFVCADGDGMGKLLESLNWNQKFPEPIQNNMQTNWNELKPWERNKVFSLGYDKCVREAFHQALAEVLIPDEPEKKVANELYKLIQAEESIVLPILPQLIGGDDLWMVVSRKYALDLCRVFAQKYMKLIQAEPMIEAARQMTGSDSLTISMGVAFTKASFPAHYMIQLAEELLKSAKALRKHHLYGRTEDAGIEGCLDWHWIESSRMEAVSAARQQAWSYKVGEDALYLTSRPWTAAQSKAFIQAAKVFQKIPRRKREQLETILRLGYRPSLLAWESWYTGLSQPQKDILKAVNQELPSKWKQETDNHTRIGFNPWRKLDENVYATPWLDLLQLQHVLGIEGQYQIAAEDTEEVTTAQQEASHV